MPREDSRRICFVTGTRAEFGLMRSTLSEIASNPSLKLQLVVTGMHLDRHRGRTIDTIRRAGCKIDAVIPWAVGDGSQTECAVATGNAVAAMARAFAELKSDIVLVTGDRVEAYAAASAAHLSGRLVAHVHGGDRALGLVDDSLRHAITKLAHVHFPATKLSASRIERMGEDRWRIFRVGSPGLDGLRAEAAKRQAIANEFPELVARRYAVLLLHPETPDAAGQRIFADSVLRAVRSVGFDQILIVYPNNDPGSEGMATAWSKLPPNPRLLIRRDVPRPQFLGIVRDAAVLVGNSSSGIIEAASFGTPVLDIGSRQTGRERGDNVVHVPAVQRAIARELRKIWNNGKSVRFGSHNIYGTGGAGARIASQLAKISSSRFLPKLIAY